MQGVIVSGGSFGPTWSKKINYKHVLAKYITCAKEFVIKRIDASPDGAPYVIVSWTSSKDLHDVIKNPYQFDPSKMIDPAKMRGIIRYQVQRLVFSPLF